MQNQPLSPTTRIVIWLAVYMIPAFTVRQPLIEYDSGWHLRSGQWILENRAIPQVDPFTTVGDDRPWIAYSWLFSLGFERLFDRFGWTGILVGRTLLDLTIVAAIHALVARRQKSMLVQAVLVATAAVALTSMFLAERPGLFSILFSILTLDAALRILDDEPLGWLWGLPAIYALWANLHIQFIHGLFLIGVAGLAALIARSLVPLRRLTVLGGLCAAATLANPYGIRLYDVVLGYGGNREIYLLFEELKSLTFRSPADWAILGLFAAAAYSLGRRTAPKLAEFLLLAAAAAFSFHARHELWIVVIVATAILSRWSVTSVADAPLSWGERGIIAGGALSAIVVWLMLGNLETKQRETTREEFPEAAVDFLDSLPVGAISDGPIFTNIEWGAYVSWRLPKRLVAIDGRAQLHGGARVKRIYDVVQGRPGWDRDPDLTASSVIVAPAASPVAELLRRSPEFQVRHEDPVAIVATRR